MEAVIQSSMESGPEPLLVDPWTTKRSKLWIKLEDACNVLVKFLKPKKNYQLPMVFIIGPVLDALGVT